MNHLDPELVTRARQLTREHLLLDTHIDVPDRLTEYYEDVSRETETGDFDYPRAKQGGLDAAFMSIYVPSGLQGTPRIRPYADSLIDLVERIVNESPDKFATARTPEDVRAAVRNGLIALPMGMENGAPIGDSLEGLDHFYHRGIRYITLTHGTNNQIGDSSYDSTETWKGLSPFGVEVVRRMNQLGMIVDVSHVSDRTFDAVLSVSTAPVVATHSSARHFTPGWERNMSDDMIRRVASKGGIIMITFGSSFLRTRYQARSTTIRSEVLAEMAGKGLERYSPEGVRSYDRARKSNPIGTFRDVADHIDHVVSIAGIDHVGFGSDFDGVFSLPEGLQDVSEYPNLIAELLARGYSEEDLDKLMGENFLRVWTEIQQLRSLPAPP